MVFMTVIAAFSVAIIDAFAARKFLRYGWIGTLITMCICIWFSVFLELGPYDGEWTSLKWNGAEIVNFKDLTLAGYSKAIFFFSAHFVKMCVCEGTVPVVPVYPHVEWV